jgi:uncharacterized membrane protein YdjX (TVP38/TMEM64 family)
MAILAILVGVAWQLERRGLLQPDLFLGLVERHPLRSVGLFLAVYAVATIALLPTLPLNLAAGMIWGGLFGGFLAALGASAGAVVAFFIARTIFGQPLERRLDGRLLSWIRREVAQGWRMVAFLRLNPIFPTGPLNYVLGLTGLPVSTYAWATLAFLLPPSLCIGFVGDRLRLVALDGDLARIWPTVLAISAAAVVLVALKRAAAHFYTGEKTS